MADDTQSPYLTLSRHAEVEHQWEINRSIFLTRLVRVQTEDQARAVIAEQRSSHREAGHHCSAFVLGAGAPIRRSSDDGEPSGTAGIPMLQALVQYRLPGTPRPAVAQQAPLSDLVAVVTRWFGGIKLGAGGLVRAYSSSVSTALDQAQLVVRQPQQQYLLGLDVATAGRDESAIRAAGIQVLDVAHSAHTVELVLSTDPGDPARDRLSTQCSALVGASVHLEPFTLDWVDTAIRSTRS